MLIFYLNLRKLDISEKDIRLLTCMRCIEVSTLQEKLYQCQIVVWTVVIVRELSNAAAVLDFFRSRQRWAPIAVLVTAFVLMALALRERTALVEVRAAWLVVILAVVGCFDFGSHEACASVHALARAREKSIYSEWKHHRKPVEGRLTLNHQRSSTLIQEPYRQSRLFW